MLIKKNLLKKNYFNIYLLFEIKNLLSCYYEWVYIPQHMCGFKVKTKKSIEKHGEIVNEWSSLSTVGKDHNKILS